MTMRFTTLPLIAVALLLLGSCAREPVLRDSAPAADDERMHMLAIIRSVGSDVDGSIQVQPLRDAAVEGLMQQAAAATRAADHAAAAVALAQALEISGEVPDLLQELAEVEIARGNWLEAEKLAVRSYSSGPKVGALCARNWQTVAEVRRVLNDGPVRSRALQRKKNCAVPPPVRR